MKVLLTGIAGRVGGHVARGLVYAGHEVTMLDRLPPPSEVAALAARTVRGEITDPAAWLAAATPAPDAVVALAGVSDERPEALAVNVGSARILGDLSLRRGIGRIVYASSNCVLGHCDRPAGEPFPLADVPVTEDHPPDHVTVYGRSKLESESVLAGAASPSTRVVALRPAWIWRDEERRRRLDGPWSDAEHYPAARLNEPIEGHRSLFSSERARRVLGWAPAHSWRS